MDEIVYVYLVEKKVDGAEADLVGIYTELSDEFISLLASKTSGMHVIKIPINVDIRTEDFLVNWEIE